MTLRKKIIWTELAIQLVAIPLGLILHGLAGERWLIAAAFILTLEAFFHVIAFFAHYLAAIETAAEWVEKHEHNGNPNGDPIEIVEKIRAETARLSLLEEAVGKLVKKSIPLEQLMPAPEDWPFQLQYQDLLKKFSDDLKSLGGGSYEKAMDDILDVSFGAAERIEFGAFCTALEENLNIFDEGQREVALRLRQYERAKQLALESKGPFGFTRLFIFDDLDAIDWQHFELMKENAQNAIRVLVAKRDAVAPVFKKHGWIWMDFGRWRRDLLMEIRGTTPDRRLFVSKNADVLDRTESLIRGLERESKELSDFISDVKDPVNLAQWSKPHAGMLDLSPPDGPHLQDRDAMFNLILPRLKDGDAIAVYGLTKLLVEGAEAAVKAASERGQKLTADVVDARHFVPPRPTPGIDYQRHNWLEWRRRPPYAAIFADDILCNLSLLQTPILFRALYECLRPGGLFVVRTTALYSQATVRPSSKEILAELRRFDPADATYVHGLDLTMLDPGAVCEAVWPTLHTDEFYDKKTRSFSLSAWNRCVQADPTLSPALRDHLTFKRLLRMTSVRYDDLESFWKGCFKEFQQPVAVYSKWQTDKELAGHAGGPEIGQRFHDYYRILVLQRL
jgi:hypothetical protein